MMRTVKASPMVRGTGMRSFCDKLTIPTDKEQQAGRRKEELDAEASGDVGFNNEPIIPPSNAGTKENPIMVRFLYFFSSFLLQTLSFFLFI